MAIPLFYFTYLGAIGVFLPFISLYLRSGGIPAAQVTQIMALGPLAALFVPPLVGLLADLRRARVWLLRLGSVATALVSIGFVVRLSERWVLVVTMLLFAFFRAPLLSLVDAAALDSGRYGRLRLWGSMGFLVAVLGAGWLHDHLGGDHVMIACTAALSAAALASFALPAPPVQARPRLLAEWRAMLARPRLWLFLAAVMLSQAAGAAYDAGFSLHLQRLGFDGQFVGQAWAVGVAAEIVLMWLSEGVLARVRAERLFTVGVLTGAVRWFLLGRVRSAAAILLLQPLHGISFGLTYVSAVHLVRARGRATPTAAQGLFAMAMMLGSLCGMTAAGSLLERLGGQGMFTVASAVALLAAGCALVYADV
jgi:MFS transporter, PPP family, 3-phenylpropionic acid transporter